MQLDAEWLEADGLGGYASGTICGTRTRRYHALLVPALTPPTGRHVLVNGFDAFVESGAGRFALSTQRYAPDVIAPDARSRLVAFASEPWPTWTFRLEDGTTIEHELFLPHESSRVVLSWRLVKRPKKKAPVRLVVRPFLSGRDHHALHCENPGFRFDVELKPLPRKELALSWHPYEGLPAVAALTNGAYTHDPHWYRCFLYEEEAARGFEATEDLGAPGEIAFDVTKDEALLVLGAGKLEAKGRVAALVRRLRALERRRRRVFATPLERAADAFLVRRGEGKTIVAGYPWFTDWGRDTFIGLRGLLLATGRLDEARSVLLEWAEAISEGMVPNRFPDRGEVAEYNAVDASLWFVIAVEELLGATRRKRVVSAADEKRLLRAVRSILESFARGARYGIRMDQDGLLACGERGQQLTWMDARADGVEVTPRIGKPVEIQALWHDALGFAASALDDGRRWKTIAADVHDAFLERFWNDEADCLFDVVDADHEPGRNDPSFRPNQILAIGGVRPLLVGPRARRVVDAVEAKLWTPLGLRTLAPADARYVGRYEGGPSRRDAAYHQGTVWPWLVGPFVDAWIRVRGGTASAKREAHRRFLQPILHAMQERGIPHLCEVTDGDPPHGWKGCPFQAWSLGELLRVANDRTAWNERKAAARAAG